MMVVGLLGTRRSWSRLLGQTALLKRKFVFTRISRLLSD